MEVNVVKVQELREVLKQTIEALSDIPDADTVLLYDFSLGAWCMKPAAAYVEFCRYSDALKFCDAKCRPEDVAKKTVHSWYREQSGDPPAASVDGKLGSLTVRGYGFVNDAGAVEDGELEEAICPVPVSELVEMLRDADRRLSDVPDALIEEVCLNTDSPTDHRCLTVWFVRWQDAEEFLRKANPDFREMEALETFDDPKGTRSFMYGEADDRLLAVASRFTDPDGNVISDWYGPNVICPEVN